jgi:uncharacterized protein (UPF0179 family)
VITLIGEDLAEVGLSFIFDGPAEACKSCRFKASCVDSLEKGRKYTIRNVKDITQKCDIHNGVVKSIEVELADIECFIDSKKVFIGSNLSYDFPECDVECVYNNLCSPEGLFKGDRCVIIKNLGKMDSDCLEGNNLTKVSLRLDL